MASNKEPLSVTHPELAAQADGWDPTTVTRGSNKKVNWRCLQGHSWQAQVNDRSKGKGCPVCSGREVLAGFNDFATSNPELAAQADGWDPTTLTTFSGRKVRWKCEIGHTWNATADARSRGSGCAVCSGRKTQVGFNDLATINPELAAQADGWDPTTRTIGSKKKVAWKCEHGHTWGSTVEKRSNGSGCPVCSGREVLAGFNDLATINPELAAQADGWDPTTRTIGSNKIVSWRCGFGHQWKALISNRSKGSGCPTCAISGFDPNKEGWLYLIDHDALDMFQIGISNFPTERISSHVRRGWEVIEIRGPMEGHFAQQLETAILHAVEHRGAVLGHKARIEKFAGYSEAWTKASLSVTSFKQLLDWVYENDDKLSLRMN